jgi:hypothetical protein
MLCGTITFGKQDPYYQAVASADGLLLLKPGETAVVKVAASVQEDGGLLRHDFVINGVALSVTMTNGIITKMVRDGNDIGVKPPELELSGKEEWVKLSRHYHEEALRLLSFTSFLGMGESAEALEFSVVGVNVSEMQFRILCENSGRNRLFGRSIRQGEVMSVNESVEEKKGSSCSILFDLETSSLTKVAGRSLFNATFFYNCDINTGGLKELAILDSEERMYISEQEWNKKGQLIRERDLKKDPYPDIDLNNVRIIKNGRAI